MYQVYVLAQALTRLEWLRLLRDVQKGILCQHRDTQTFVAALGPHYPDFQVEDAALFEQVYRGQPFLEARLRVLRTYFKEILEEFLVQDALQQKPALREQLLMRALLSRNCIAAAKRLREAQLAVSGEAALSIEGLQDRFELEELGLEVHIRENNRTEGFSWRQLLQRHGQYTLTHRLRFLCAMKSESNFVAIQAADEENLIAAALQEFHRLGPEQPPLTIVYAQLLQLLTSEDFAQHFAAVQDWITQYGHRTAAVERLNIVGLWINFLLQGDRRGLANCLPLTLQAYQTLVELNLFYNAGSFSLNSARNAVAIAARLGELDWAWDFLARVKAQFAEAEANRLYFYGAAYLAYSEGNFSKAKKLLAQGDFSDPFYKFAQALLLLRISYDTGEDDLFLSIHAAMSRQLSRKEKVTSAYRESFRSFLKMAFGLFECRALDAKPEQVQALVQQYHALPLMGLREWVLAKLQDLGGGIATKRRHS